MAGKKNSEKKTMNKTAMQRTKGGTQGRGAWLSSGRPTSFAA